MKGMELIDIPDEMFRGHAKITYNFGYAYDNMNEPTDYRDFVLVKILSICNCLLLKKNIPMYTTDKDLISEMKAKSFLLKRDGITPSEEDILSEEFNLAQDEVLYDYITFCSELPFCLTAFGWELTGKYNDGICCGPNEKIALDSISGMKRLSACEEYADFIEGKKEMLKNNDIASTIYIFKNKRLGKYMQYALKNPVSQQLHAKIIENLSFIQTVWGAENVIYSNKLDGYEIAYVIISDLSDYPTEHQTAFSSNMDIFLPIYAGNLEKLLDRAYALYPIESEEKINGEFGTNKDSN